MSGNEITKTLQKRVPNPKSAQEETNAAQTQTFNPTPQLHNVSLAGDLTTTPKLEKEQKTVDQAGKSDSDGKSDKEKEDKMTQKIKKQESRIQELKDKLKKEEEKLKTMQQGGKKGGSDQSKLSTSTIKSQSEGTLLDLSNSNEKQDSVVEIPTM
ncbi:hypothetical protein PCASD_12536 [Puccinia coronata f. sp. avenae]|uniref:Uncharacterized protein n=1 Tax=Puccinia coronata f. sp. avenae TaxID=200324 RepID=A0A2N5TBS9_9BASI|nr:hypothetical protein PCASD_12536 [Puccinia coronata f. sp. avenae]